MMQNRELTRDDYLAMLRRRLKMILVPTLVAPLAGLLVSYAFAPKYTSQSLILVVGQKVAENMVQPVVFENLTARVVMLQQQVLSQSRLQPMLERRYPGNSHQQINEMIDGIRSNMQVEPIMTDLTQIGSTSTAKRQARPASVSPVPGFYVEYTAPNPNQAKQICDELTALMVSENLQSVQAAANGTSDVLNKGLDDAKHNLGTLDAKLAAFKKKYVGQLPGDEENNLKILAGLNSQLEANTETLNRAQQDKSYTESMLAQRLAAWNSTQSSTNPETLEKQLSDLQSQLLQLQAKYTDDHLDVIKAKADIGEVERKLAEVNRASADATNTDQKASAIEPREIRQLRLQIEQYEDLIAARTGDQKRLQREIEFYQGRVSLSPAMEEQYKQLTRYYDNAQKDYQDLLAKRSAADLTTQTTNRSEGEQMLPLNSAKPAGCAEFSEPAAFRRRRVGRGAGGGTRAGAVVGIDG